MKHAAVGALDALGDLLNSLRARSTLVEKRPGIFYVRAELFCIFTRIPPVSSPTCGKAASGSGWR